MYHRHLFGVTLLGLVLGAGHALADTAANGPEAAPAYTAEAARTELGELYRTLQASHFDLFVHRTKAAYDARYANLLAAWTRPFSHFELEVALQRFMAYGRVAHSRIDFPSLEFEKFRGAGGGVLPLEVRIRNGHAYVVADLGDPEEPSILPGEEIVAINGIAFPLLRDRLLAHVSADNDRLADTLLELRFTALLWLELGPMKRFDLGVSDEHGSVRSLQRNARTRTQMREADGKRSKQLQLDWNRREARMLDEHIAYLRPGPFYDNRPDAGNIWDPTAFGEFIETSFATFRSAGARSLIIDLRNNPGGDNSFSDLLVKRYADQRFRFASHFRIKVSQATTASNAKRLKPGDTGVVAQLAAAYAKHRNGDIVEFPIEWVEPVAEDQRFNGQVYLLINRYSYSNTVMVAALSQDFHFATILGEETADLASTYGAMEQFKLPASGIEVGYPKAHIVRPSGDTTSRGVVPDFTIETPLLEDGGDPVLKRASALVRAGVAPPTRSTASSKEPKRP